MRVALILALVSLIVACSSDDEAKAKMEAERKAAIEKAEKLKAVTKPDPAAAVVKEAPSQDELVATCASGDGAACQGACALGHAESCVKLGTLFEEGRGGVPESFESARVFHRKGCDGGAGGGCYAMALFYKLGKSIPKDPKRAKKYFERACELEFEAACLELKKPSP